MLMLYGRRRLGKTYLLQRFFAGTPGDPPKPHCYFLADQTTAPSQRLQLATEVLAALPDAGVSAGDLAVSWNQILRHVSAHARANTDTPRQRFALILDEFPYLVAQSPELPSVLQAWWDREGTHAPLLVVLCGSQLGAMAALGTENAPLFGRFTAGTFRLGPLRYDEIAAFYDGSPAYTDVADRLLMYGVLGGTPRYHALVDTSRPPADEIVALLLRPRGALEGEVGYLLGSEQIRDPAPYNATLAAIAGGATGFGDILTLSGAERGVLSFYLRTLIDLGWVRRELPFEETSEKRGLYQIADPFLWFWYRFVQPLAPSLPFADPAALYQSRVAPFLSDYMGRYVFEAICGQWLQRHAASTLALDLAGAGRWWSRDGQVEMDILARRADGGYLLGECKWSRNSPVGVEVYARLLAKAERLPDARIRQEPKYVLFSVGGFTGDLTTLARDRRNRLHLVGPDALLPPTG